MRKLKLFIWITLLLVIKITIINRIGYFNYSPDPLFAFAVAYTIIEEDFSYGVYVSIICGMCIGALSSVNFPVSVLFYGYSAVIITALKGKARHIPNCVKTYIYTAVLSFAGGSAMYFVMNLSYDKNTVLTIILPYVVCNVIAAAIIYPIVKKTLLIIDEKKKLIPE